MPVADVEELVALALDPAGLREGLTLGAVAVAAGRILNGGRPTGVALRCEAAEGGRAATHQCVGCPVLLRREPVRVPIAAEPRAQDIGDLQRRPGGGRRMAGAVHRSGAAGVRELQQIQGRRRGPDPVLGQVQVAHGGANGAVSEAALDDGQFDAGLEQAGGVSIALIPNSE